MCKKILFQIESVPSTDEEQTFLLNVNNELHELLSRQKNMITDYFKSKKWDKYKKHSNSYELIFTSCHTLPSIASYSPISRSYFKLWETLHDFEEILELNKRDSIKACFLAEGPGGFIEAFCDYRDQAKLETNDQLYGMTLISSSKNVPSWKLSDRLIRNKKVQLLTGADGSGSLYNPENVEYLKREVGRHSCQLVTADGGFDFSADFNNQEELSLKLVAAELYAALQLQAEDGTFILKIFDIHAPATIALISVLKQFYKKIYVTKPFSSRPANSEKYLVCTGYKVDARALTIALQAIAKIVNNPHSELGRQESSVLNSVIQYNITYVIKQATSINKTLAYINGLARDPEQLKPILKKQIKKALKWCYKYNVPINTDAIKYYKAMM